MERYFKNGRFNIGVINREAKENANVDFAGIVTTVKLMLTKKKDKMAFIQVADLDDEIEVVVFPKSYELFKDKIVKDTPLRFFGKVNMKNKEEDTSATPNEDGSEKKSYGAKAIILEEIKSI